MTWVLVAVAVVVGLAVTWFLTANRGAGQSGATDAGRGGQHRSSGPQTAGPDEHDEVDDASGFGGTPTPPSHAVGPAEAWMRDAEDEDALLRHDEPADAGLSAAPGVNVPPVPAATPNGDLAGVGEPKAVAAVEAESEATAPTPEGEPAEDPRARD